MIRKLTKIFIFSLVIFSFQTLSAQAAFICHVSASCTGSEVSVLELSDTTNAHTALPGAGYPYSVCCSGGSGLSTSCSQNKVFAKLSGVSNAHVRLNSQADYPGSNNACLSVSSGSLTIKNQDNNCNGFDSTIISLAKVPTNSHAGEGNAYSHKICVTYNAPTSSGSGGWIPNFFGGGVVPEPVIPVATVVPVSVLFRPIIATSNVSAINNLTAPEPDFEFFQTLSMNDQIQEEAEVIPDQSQDNLQVAAVSGLSGLITSTWFKVISVLAILVMILLARKFYLKQK